MTQDTGGPAFPRPASTDEHTNPCNVYQDQIGLTKREYFAAAALQGMGNWWPSTPGGYVEKAIWAYSMADAMLRVGKGEE